MDILEEKDEDELTEEEREILDYCRALYDALESSDNWEEACEDALDPDDIYELDAA